MDYQLIPTRVMAGNSRTISRSSTAIVGEETELLIPKDHDPNNDKPIVSSSSSPRPSSSAEAATITISNSRTTEVACDSNSAIAPPTTNGVGGIPLSVVAANPLIEIQSNSRGGKSTYTYLSHRFANERDDTTGGITTSSSSSSNSSYSSCCPNSKDDENTKSIPPSSSAYNTKPTSYLSRCRHVFSLTRFSLNRYTLPTLEQCHHRITTKTTTKTKTNTENKITTYRGIVLAICLALIAILLRNHHIGTSSSLEQQQQQQQQQQPQPLWGSALEAKLWNLIWGDESGHSHTNESSNKTDNDTEAITNLFDTEDEVVLHLRPIAKLHSHRHHSSSNNPPYYYSYSPFYQKKSPFPETKLVVAGKLTVNDVPCNIAELGLETLTWSLKERIQLSLYNSYSGGEVYYLLANHTFEGEGGGGGGSDDGGVDPQVFSTSSKSQQAGGDLIVVGAFDTTDRNSQVTYCSVGAWDGTDLSKVGEGLCNSALSKGMKITAAALAGPQDVFVGGSFETRVWNGDRHEFVNIFNIAHYNAVDQVWLPLSIGQITCSWCTVTILSLAWDSTRRQLHVAGKFNSVDGANIPSGLAIYHQDTGHLVAHPGGGLTMFNMTQNGVGTALQLDEQASVLYVMGSFERLGTGQICFGLAAYEINANHWTCLADPAHTVLPSGGGNMLLTPYGLMVAGRTTSFTTWGDSSHPYTIALLKATPKKEDSSTSSSSEHSDHDTKNKNGSSSKHKTAPAHDFEWSWLPGFNGHDQPLHSLANGFGEHEGAVFIAGDDLVAKWHYEEKEVVISDPNYKASGRTGGGTNTVTRTIHVPVTVNLSKDHVRGAVMAIAQLSPRAEVGEDNTSFGYTLAVYLIAFGALMGMFIALLCNRSLNQAIISWFYEAKEVKGISLDTLTYGARTNMNDAYQKAMRNRCVSSTNGVQLIDPQSIILHRIIGEGTFGRVWSANLNSSSVAVKEFVFAQAAVAGRSTQQDSIIEDIIGEAGMMSILRHPNVLQLFGCSLTAQAIWIVSELCSLGSLRQLLDNRDMEISLEFRARIALQVAEGMMYLHNQSPPIIHRDLKSHNILVHETFAEANDVEYSDDRTRGNIMGGYRVDQTEKLTVEQTIVAKIGDWGSAKATLSGSQTMTHGVGTSCWLAPEVIRNARSSKYSDVYSYGIILWEMATRAEVYANLESTQIIAQVANDNLRPPVPDNCPWASIMVRCWSEDPYDRPTFKEIVKGLNQVIDDLNGDEQSSITEWSHPSQASYQKAYVDDV